MAETGLVYPPQQYPDTRQPHPKGDPGSRLFFFLRQAPKPVTLMAVGNNPLDIRLRAIEPAVRPLAPQRSVIFLVRPASGQILPSPLIRARALGNPAVSPQLRPAGLVRTRAQGVPAVIPPPVTPPVIPPDTPPVTPVTSPRNLRYVRRRNRPPERN